MSPRTTKLSPLVEPLQEDITKLLERLGLEAPELSSNATHISISELFWWLRAFVAMADSGNRTIGDLSTTVAARSLSVVIYKLLPASTGADAHVMKAQLLSMREATFQWPSPEEVRPNVLLPLPKNIAKNFTGTFFRSKGETARTGLRLGPTYGKTSLSKFGFRTHS
jgi:hypothetical protein